MSGIFCLTGIDGCGKGTHISLILDRLKKEGYPAFYSKAYSDLEKERFSFLMPLYSDRARMFLFQAFHAEQYVRAMSALDKGEIVVADRWDDSYLAYHGSSRSFLSEPAMQNAYELLNALAFRERKADRTVMLDVSVDIAEERTRVRGQDYFDRLGTEYHQLMRQRYLHLAAQNSWTVIDGSLPVDVVHEQLWDVIMKMVEPSRK